MILAGVRFVYGRAEWANRLSLKGNLLFARLAATGYNVSQGKKVSKTFTLGAPRPLQVSALRQSSVETGAACSKPIGRRVAHKSVMIRRHEPN